MRQLYWSSNKSKAKQSSKCVFLAYEGHASPRSIGLFMPVDYNTRWSENEKACKEKMKQSSFARVHASGVVVRLIASDRGGVLHTWSIRWNRSSVKQGEKERERKKGRKEGDEAKKLEPSKSKLYILLCSILSRRSFSLIYRDTRDIYNRSSLNQIYVVKTNFFLSTIDAKCPWNKFSPRNVKGLPRLYSIVTYIHIYIVSLYTVT